MSAASSPTRRTIWYDGSFRRKHFRPDRRCQQPEFRKPKHGMLRPFSLRDERSWLRRVAQGERVDVGRNRVAIALRQHRRVGHNLGHGRTYTAVVRCLSRLQHLRDILLRPVADPPWRDVWDVSNAFRISAPGETGFRFDGSEDVPGRMTFRAVRHRLGEILTAIPGVAAAGIRTNRVAVEV